MTIDLKMASETGNISYQMNFDTVLSAVTYGDEEGCDYQVLVSYYSSERDEDVTKVVYQSASW